MHQRSLTQVRPGSSLQEPLPETEKPKLRGVWQKERDEQLALHTTRMAKLDVIAEIAKKIGDEHLAHRVEVVRRGERERFRLAMERIRGAARAQAWKGKR